MDSKASFHLLSVKAQVLAGSLSSSFKPNEDSVSTGVHPAHLVHLMPSLLQTGLIDAYGVHPEDTVFIWPTQMLKRQV